MDNKKKVSPWAWIPSLYFAQGLPYVAVMTIFRDYVQAIGYFQYRYCFIYRLVIFALGYKTFLEPFR